MSRMDPSASTTRRHPNGSYFIRHWRGQCSLGISYWVGGVVSVLGPVLVFRFGVLGLDLVFGRALELRWMARTVLLCVLASSALVIWSNVGIWRAARQTVLERGASVWSVAAQLTVAFWVLLILNMALTFRESKGMETLDVALGRDPMPRIEAKLSSDGKTLLLSGRFGDGSAERVEHILRSARAVTQVELDSAGGRVSESMRIAETIRARKLDTFVPRLCASACTLVFVSGLERTMAPGARMGFHLSSKAPRFIESRQSRTIVAAYQKIGVQQVFIDKVRAANGERGWYPTYDELLDNHILTRAVKSD